MKLTDVLVGKTISSLFTTDEDTRIHVWFVGGMQLEMFDEVMCCEARYFRTDDTLKDYADSDLLGIEVRDTADPDVLFLVLITSKGNVTFSAHNDHNGYYGGFALSARVLGVL